MTTAADVGTRTAAEVALRINGLQVVSRAGSREVPILRDIDLELRDGEIVGVVGESGSGKSTLCRAIARRLPSGLAVRGGSIQLRGLDVLAGKPERLHRLPHDGVRMIFQDPLKALNPVMTVGDQCVEAAMAGRTRSRPEALARSIDLLERMGITNARSRMGDYPYQFSGGQRQRIVVSIALAGEPAVLLADEPTSALDVSTQAALLELIRQVCAERNTAVLFVSHNYAVVAQLCSRILVLYDGRTMELGPSEVLLSRSRHPYTAALIASLPSIDHRVTRLPAIPGQPPRRGEAAYGCPFQPRCRYAAHACRTAPIQLTDVGPAHQSACLRVDAIWPASRPGRSGRDDEGVDP